MSLYGERYASVSNLPLSVLRLNVASVTIDSGLFGSDTTPLPRWRISPLLPVTYQPPHRSAKGVRWSSRCEPSGLIGVPFGSGYTLRTSIPGISRLFLER